MTSIAVVDYQAGNIASVVKGLEAVGARVRVPIDPGMLAGAGGIVVPGVGHYAQTAVLDHRWREAIRAAVAAGRPVLGICLGMQWLFEGSEEAPGVAGLGVFDGRCERLAGTVKIPQVGWNSLEMTGRGSVLLGDEGVDGRYAYFANSYAAPVAPEATATSRHGRRFSSVVERACVFGVQFHPEKSAATGLGVLRRFVTLAGTSAVATGSGQLGGSRSRVEVAPISREAAEPRGRVAQNSCQADAPPGRVAPLSCQMDAAPSRVAPLSCQLQRQPPGLTRRIIACLDLRDRQVVKGVQFEDLRSAGDPAELARRYNREGIDEVVVLDVTATLEGRRALTETIRQVARELFIPLTVGGGIRTEDDAARIVEAGADKVSLNSAALADPSILTRLATRYGSQAVVVAIDAARSGDRDSATGRERYRVRSRSGTTAEPRDAVEWAREAEGAGAGEVLLTSIDRDGTRTGFDCEMTAAVSAAVGIPVIASGGAGTFEHFAEVFDAGRADAALAASVFHFADHAVADLKARLARRGIPVRPVTPPFEVEC